MRTTWMMADLQTLRDAGISIESAEEEVLRPAPHPYYDRHKFQIAPVVLWWWLAFIFSFACWCLIFRFIEWIF